MTDNANIAPISFRQFDEYNRTPNDPRLLHPSQRMSQGGRPRHSSDAWQRHAAEASTWGGIMRPNEHSADLPIYDGRQSFEGNSGQRNRADQMWARARWADEFARQRNKMH